MIFKTESERATEWRSKKPDWEVIFAFLPHRLNWHDPENGYEIGRTVWLQRIERKRDAKYSSRYGQTCKWMRYRLIKEKS